MYNTVVDIAVNITLFVILKFHLTCISFNLLYRLARRIWSVYNIIDKTVRTRTSKYIKYSLDKTKHLVGRIFILKTGLYVLTISLGLNLSDFEYLFFVCNIDNL